jgi:hypothetical protein
MSTNQPPNFGNAYVQYFIDKQKEEDEKRKKTYGSVSAPIAKTTYNPTQKAPLTMPLAANQSQSNTSKTQFSQPKPNIPKHIIPLQDMLPQLRPQPKPALTPTQMAQLSSPFFTQKPTQDLIDFKKSRLDKLSELRGNLSGSTDTSDKAAVDYYNNIDSQVSQLQNDVKRLNDSYMAQPTILSPFEQKARELQSQIKSLNEEIYDKDFVGDDDDIAGLEQKRNLLQKQYDDLTNTDQYMQANINRWLILASKADKLTRSCNISTPPTYQTQKSQPLRTATMPSTTCSSITPPPQPSAPPPVSPCKPSSAGDSLKASAPLMTLVIVYCLLIMQLRDIMEFGANSMIHLLTMKGRAVYPN